MKKLTNLFLIFFLIIIFGTGGYYFGSKKQQLEILVSGQAANSAGLSNTASSTGNLPVVQAAVSANKNLSNSSLGSSNGSSSKIVPVTAKIPATTLPKSKITSAPTATTSTSASQPIKPITASAVAVPPAPAAPSTVAATPPVPVVAAAPAPAPTTKVS